MTVASRKVVAWIWLFFFVGLIGGSAIWVSVLVKQVARNKATPPPVLGQVSDFELTDQDGRKVSLRDLKGKLWIADFIFTRCAGPCPLMSSRMAELQNTIAGVPNVQLVSFSVDPVYDQPELLKEYGRRYGAKPDLWLFLTGDEKRIHEMIVKDFKMGVAPAGADPTEQPIIHGTHFVLVDGEGRIRGYYGVAGPELGPEGSPAIESAVRTKAAKEDVLSKIVRDITAIRHASR